MKSYYQDRGITLYCGDCRDILPNTETGSSELLLTDIPYGEVNRESSGLRDLDKREADAETFALNEFWQLISGVGQSKYVWCGWEQVSELRRLMREGGLSTRLAVWEKTNPSPMNGKKIWLSGIETCLYGKRPNAYFNRSCEVPVFKGPSRRIAHKTHATPKPLWLFKEIIDASCPPGGTVVDPCAGTGTALLAAKQMGRRAVGVELYERHCEVIAERLSQGELFAA